MNKKVSKRLKAFTPKTMTTHKMTLEDFDRWIEALESGKYRQRMGRLCTPVGKRFGFCCLGVDVDVNLDAWWEFVGGYWTIGGNEYYIEIKWPCRSPALALRLAQAFRISADAARGGVEGILATANDAGYSFREIAAVLKSQRSWIFKLEGEQ